VPRISVELSDELHKRLRGVACERDLTVQSLVSSMVEVFIARHDTDPEADSATVIQSTVENTRELLANKERTLAGVESIYATCDPLAIAAMDATVAFYIDFIKRRSQGE